MAKNNKAKNIQKVNFKLPEYYFAYGSNLHKIQMKSRCPKSVPVSRATLEKWTLVFKGVADIIPHPSGRVNGAIYKLTDPEDIKSIRRYEGWPHLYREEIVEVKLPDGRKVMAFVYVMNGYGYGLPYQDYFETIEVGFENWHIDKSALARALHRTIREESGRGYSKKSSSKVSSK